MSRMSESMLAREEAAARKAEATITEQSATIALLREALEPFAAMWDYFVEEFDGMETATVNPYDYRSAKSGDCRKANELLSALPEQAGVSDSKMLDWLEKQLGDAPGWTIGIVPGAPFIPFTISVGHMVYTSRDVFAETLREAITTAMQADGAALGATEGEETT